MHIYARAAVEFVSSKVFHAHPCTRVSFDEAVKIHRCKTHSFRAHAVSTVKKSASGWQRDNGFAQGRTGDWEKRITLNLHERACADASSQRIYQQVNDSMAR